MCALGIKYTLTHKCIRPLVDIRASLVIAKIVFGNLALINV